MGATCCKPGENDGKKAKGRPITNGKKDANALLALQPGKGLDDTGIEENELMMTGRPEPQD
jgi:hypothetical protein